MKCFVNPDEVPWLTLDAVTGSYLKNLFTIKDDNAEVTCVFQKQEKGFEKPCLIERRRDIRHARAHQLWLSWRVPYRSVSLLISAFLPLTTTSLTTHPKPGGQNCL